jgi:hypothetical protein
MEVYYHGNFWGHYTDEPAGKEITLHHQFHWNGRTWRIPAVYVCTSGIVVDYCIRIPNPEIERFLEKWEEKAESRRLTAEEEEQIERENPLRLHAFTDLTINGIPLERNNGCGNTWYPAHKQFTDEQVMEELMEAYHCDRSDGWYFSRETFAWPDGLNADTVLHSLAFHLHTVPTAHPNAHFVTEDGNFPKEIRLIHPNTHQEHLLHIHACEPDTLPKEAFASEVFQNQEATEFPTHFQKLTYTLSPALSAEEFCIRDCAPCDPPRKPRTESYLSDSTYQITEAQDDGLTAVYFALSKPMLGTPSSLHFAPVTRVKWRTIFYCKDCEDITIELEPSTKN